MTGHNRYKVMSNELEPKPTPSQPVVYQIRLKGHLDSQWTDWFEGLTITLEDDGDTLLTGPVVDQSALHGLLKKVRDLGMPLVSVNQVQFNETHPYRSKKEKEMNTNQIDHRNRSKSKTFVVMDICNSQYGLCGYSFFDGSSIHYPRNHGGNSIACGRFAGGRNRNGNFICHGYPALGIELQSKSLGNHHHWGIHDFANRYRRARSVLCVF